MVFLSLSAAAKERSEAEMQSIAKQVLGLSINAQSRSQSTQLSKYASTAQLSIYGSKGAGFVVMSKEDTFPAILGYSETDYSESNMPCGFKWWMEEANRSLQTRVNSGEPYAPANIKATSSATNFIKTSWNQMAPYNSLCPKIDGTPVPTGCVATAMAQIMYYFKYPESGKGTGSYIVTDAQEASTAYTLDINSTYAWSKMKERYIRPVDIDNAVATLMRDAGAASKMQYSSDGSGTNDIYAAKGFCENFRYDSLAVKRYSRYFYTDQEWMDIVSTELAAEKPILYCGQDPQNGGHAFVFDGIDEQGLVHVNWGWSGIGNGWYDINILKPTAYGGGGLNNGEGYKSSQSMIFNIKPQEAPDPSEENTSLWVSSEYGFSVKDKKLYIQIYDVYNMDFKYFDGVVEIALENKENPSDVMTSLIVDTKEDKEVVPPASGYIFSDTDDAAEFDLSEDFPNIAPGTYRLYIRSKSATESAYQYVREIGGPKIYNLTVAADGNMSISKESSTTSIKNICAKSDQQTKERIFDMNGRQMPSPQCVKSGIYFVKKGNYTYKVLKQ